MSENKKFDAVELNDELLDSVAGGVIEYDTWKKMTQEERQAAQEDSAQKRKAKQACPLD